MRFFGWAYKRMCVHTLFLPCTVHVPPIWIYFMSSHRKYKVSDAEFCSVSQRIKLTPCNSTITGKFPYHIQNNPSLEPILSRLNPIHIPFNITVLFTRLSSKWIFPSGFQTKMLYAFLISPISNPSHLSWFHNPNNILWRYKLWSSALRNFVRGTRYFIHPFTRVLD